MTYLAERLGELRRHVDHLRELERLPRFRNVVMHEYVALDMDLVVAALRNPEPVDRFIRAAARMEQA